MGISIANTLTPRLWKGEPKVVIRGQFVLGLAGGYADSKVYFASHLNLGELARAVTGTTFSLQVLGRCVPSSYDGSAEVDDTVYSGISYIPDAVYYYYSANLSNNPYDVNDVGTFVTPKIYFKRYLEWRGYDKTDSAERNAKTSSAGTQALGTLVAPDVRIVLRGALDMLNVTKLNAVAFSNADSNGSSYVLYSSAWFSQYYYDQGAFAPGGVGWRTTDVHIYDSPQLRGHVTAGSVPVIWE